MKIRCAMHITFLSAISSSLTVCGFFTSSAIHITFLSIILSSSSTVCGFSTSSSEQQRPPRKDFTTKIVEDAVVKDVSSKVLRRNNKKASGINNNPKPLNSREKSFTQRDPIISLNMNLDYLAKSGQRDAAKRCEEMLTRIEALHADGYYEKAPDVVSYNSVINSYAHGRTSPSPNSRSSNAKRLMKRMEVKGIQPNTVTYNTLLRCIMKEISATPRQKDKIQEAETILRYMEGVNLANTISYNTIISMHSKSNLDESAERAEKWLQRMIELYNENPQNDKIQPDTVSFNSVIHAYSNTPITKGAPERAKKAKALLDQMETLYKSGENDNVKPDTVSYSAVVNAYAKAPDSLCAVKALALLEHMEDLHKSGNKDVKPNKRTYTSCINAFGRIGNPKAADDLLTKMKEQYKLGDVSLKPDTITYSSVLNAYARKGGEDSAYRADELLSEMFDLYNSGNYDVKPNTQIFRTVITALGKSKHSRGAEKAERLLGEMEDLSSQYPDVAPNTICYNAVIDAWSRSKLASKAYRAELLLEKMLEEAAKGNTMIQPDTITYNSVISACARSPKKDEIIRKEAFSIGLNAFRQLHSLDYCKPSSITYISYLKLLCNLTERGRARDHMAERVYSLSVSFGLSNDAAVKAQLKRTCSTPSVFKSIILKADQQQTDK